ncbi:MAG: acyl-CoA carboxylase subunit beta [Vulcanimicrobiaceae bacterium]
MVVLASKVDSSSVQFRQNAAAAQSLIDELERRRAVVAQGGGPAAQERHRQRGKLLPRDRVAQLLDDPAEFFELSPLAAWGMYDGESPAASVITGFGMVSGTQCMVIAHDATAKGGASYPMSVQKTLRAQEIALENRLTCIYLVESAGANLRYQAEFFAHLGARMFANETRMSALGIPQIAVVFGNATAGGAYVPGLADYAIFVAGQAKVFLAGPPLVKMATGEEIDAEELGGASMHASKSGLADYVVEEDAQALVLVRRIVASGNCVAAGTPGRIAPEEPQHDAEEILGIIPVDRRRTFDMREILARIVDGSRFLEFKATFGTSVVAGHAHIDGYPVGILANNNILYSESAMKATQFVQLCDQSGTPLIFLQNITGFMVGKVAEQGGIIKHGSMMINAVANASVPKITIIVGASYGAGNYSMCGRGLDPTLLLTWPTSHIAVMGAKQAAGVLAAVSSSASEETRAQIEGKFEEESSPYYATARLWDDGIIDPRQTRLALARALAMARNRNVPAGRGRYGTFRM